MDLFTKNFCVRTLVRELKKLKCDFSCKKGPCELPIYSAIENGDSEMAELLVDLGSPVSPLPGTFSPLAAACQRGDLEMVKILLRAGASLEAASMHDQHAIVEAAASGSVEVVEYLLEAGANPDSVDNVGRTPLITAALEGGDAIIELLLSRGANKSIKDKYNKSALDYCERSNKVTRRLLS